MKIKLIIFQSLLSITLFAQENSKVESRTASLGIFFSPDYTKAIYRNPAFGFNTGIHFLKMVSNRVRIDCGLSFSNVGSRNPGADLFSPDGTVIDPPYGTRYTLVQNHQFFEVPVKIDFLLVKRSRINFYLMAGIAPAIFIRTSTRYDIYKWGKLEMKGESFTEDHPVFKGLLLSSILGLGFDIKLNDRWSIALQPSIRRYFNENKPRSIGLNSGIVFNI